MKHEHVGNVCSVAFSTNRLKGIKLGKPCQLIKSVRKKQKTVH